MSPAALGRLGRLGRGTDLGRLTPCVGLGASFLGASQSPHLICLCRLFSFMFVQRFNSYSSLPHPSQRCLPSHLQRVNVIEYSDTGGLG